MAAEIAPARDHERALAEARSRRAGLEALAAATARLEREHLKAESEREAVIKRLRVEISRLAGEQQSQHKTIDRLDYEVGRRRILAPAAGRLADVTILRAGAYVEEGRKLAVLIPRGGLRIVAEFPPPAALGRIRPGQKAWMRLEGFPWTQYGTLRATVEHAGDEVRDGRVRVELRVDDPAARAASARTAGHRGSAGRDGHSRHPGAAQRRPPAGPAGEAIPMSRRFFAPEVVQASAMPRRSPWSRFMTFLSATRRAPRRC